MLSASSESVACDARVTCNACSVRVVRSVPSIQKKKQPTQCEAHEVKRSTRSDYNMHDADSLHDMRRKSNALQELGVNAKWL